MKTASTLCKYSGYCVNESESRLLPVVEGQREAPASMARSAARKRSSPARSPVTAAERHPRRAACCVCACGCGALGFVVASSAPAVAVAVAVAVMYTLIAGVETARSLYARLPWADWPSPPLPLISLLSELSYGLKNPSSPSSNNALAPSAGQDGGCAVRPRHRAAW